MPKIDVIVGTRPDAIKMRPLIEELRKSGRFEVRVVSTGQHADLLSIVLKGSVSIDIDLAVMCKGQESPQIIAKILDRYGKLMKESPPDLVLVHGDTASSFGAAMAAFYNKVDVGHVEAGLRSQDLKSPHPEEGHRRMISQISRFHFATNELAQSRLVLSGIDKKTIFITGNTIENALNDFLIDGAIVKGQRKHTTFNILLTVHRAEKSIREIETLFEDISRFMAVNPSARLNYVVHPRPDIRKAALSFFHKSVNVQLIESQSHSSFLNMILNSDIVLTDSGGIQEEAVFLKKRVLLLRNRTERIDGFAEGFVRLVDASFIFEELSLAQLKSKSSWRHSNIEKCNPVGKITEIITRQFSHAERAVL